MIEVEDFELEQSKSQLYHFQIGVDNVFRFKVFDFLQHSKRIYLPQITLDTTTQISIFLINEQGLTEDIQQIQMPFYSSEVFELRFKNEIKMRLKIKTEKVENDNR